MKQDEINELYKKYGLEESDVFQHKHYLIITRQGIDKIQAKENIFIDYESITSTPEFCVVKATAKKDTATIQTFGSAKYGAKTWDDAKKKWDEQGNTTTWYVMEMAEKRAMSRAVLKLTGFYELGIFGEDESEDFKKTSEPKKQEVVEQKVNADPKKIPTPKRLTPEQVKLIPTSDELQSLLTVLAQYSLSTVEKSMIDKRINELKK